MRPDNGKPILVICSVGLILLAVLVISAITKLETDVFRLVLAVGGVIVAAVAVVGGGIVAIRRRTEDGAEITAEIGRKVRQTDSKPPFSASR